MSFSIVCENCGAPSSPSTGVCPFCKSIARLPAGAESHSLIELRNVYMAGDLPRALSFCATLSAEDPKIMGMVEFLVLYAKILIETEGPSSKIKSLLGKAYMLPGATPEVAEYLDLIEARSLLTKEANDEGERKLSRILRRSPNNVHALFLLGAHFFWVSGDAAASARYLEKCVRLYPKFLRAWGCLGSIYEKLENLPLATKAYRECLGLETEPNMKAFFQKKITSLTA